MVNKIPRTRVIFGEEIKEKVIKGIDILERAVSSTLGPRSRAVGIDQIYRWKINKDGVSVAKAIHLEDPNEDFGVKVVREAAQKTVDEVGDGTTVTIVLARAIIHEALNAINSGIKPMSLREGLEQDVEILTKELDKLRTPITTYEEKLNIATISASGDRELGLLIADTFEKIGEEGILTVQESKDLQTKVEIQEGMQLEHGYSNPFFINNAEKMSAIYENVPILVSGKNLLSIAEVGPMLVNVSQKTSSLIIIAPEVSMDIMEVLVREKIEGRLQTLVIKAPGVGENQREILRDIAALSGAKFITAEAGHKFNELTIDDLGKLSRIVSSKTSTIMINNDADKTLVGERIATIKAQMEDQELSEFEREKLKERLGKLTNGIAVLKIGGVTEVEMQERKERAEDAVGATKAAIREGTVPGGEVAYLTIREKLPQDSISSSILYKALEAPFNKLLLNAGYEAAAFRDHLKGQGFDVTDGKIKDMIKAGIIDPVAVPKAALRNAVSVANQIITLGTVITQVPEENK